MGENYQPQLVQNVQLPIVLLEILGVMRMIQPRSLEAFQQPMLLFWFLIGRKLLDNIGKWHQVTFMPDFLDNHGISSKIFIPSLPVFPWIFGSAWQKKDPRIKRPLQQAPASLSQLSPATNVTSDEFSSLTFELWPLKVTNQPIMKEKILFGCQPDRLPCTSQFFAACCSFHLACPCHPPHWKCRYQSDSFAFCGVADKQIRNSKRKVLSQNKIKFPRTRLNCRSPIQFPFKNIQTEKWEGSKFDTVSKKQELLYQSWQYAPLMTPLSTEFTWFLVDASQPIPSQPPAEAVLHVDSKATIQQQEENPQMGGSWKGFRDLVFFFKLFCTKSLRCFSMGGWCLVSVERSPLGMELPLFGHTKHKLIWQFVLASGMRVYIYISRYSVCKSERCSFLKYQSRSPKPFPQVASGNKSPKSPEWTRRISAKRVGWPDQHTA